MANASNNYVPGVYGDVSQFSCHRGHWFEDGVYELQTSCTAAGVWEPTLPAECKSMHDLYKDWYNIYCQELSPTTVLDYWQINIVRLSATTVPEMSPGYVEKLISTNHNAVLAPHEVCLSQGTYSPLLETINMINSFPWAYLLTCQLAGQVCYLVMAKINFIVHCKWILYIKLIVIRNKASALALPYKFSPSLFFIFFIVFFFLQCSNAKCIYPSKTQTIELRFMKFGTGVPNNRVDPENQGHRSRSLGSKT